MSINAANYGNNLDAETERNAQLHRWHDDDQAAEVAEEVNVPMSEEHHAGWYEGIIGPNPHAMSGVVDAINGEMTNEQYDRWYVDFYEPDDSGEDSHEQYVQRYEATKLDADGDGA